MASEILGLFTTPEQYQLAQQEAQQAQAARYANLDPMARANYGVYRAGQQLANTIGGALGGEDPQLKLISQRQQLLSQLDQSDPTSFARVAKIASDAGDQQLALGIANAGRQAAIQIAQANKEKQLAVNPDILKSQTSAQIQDTIDQYKLLPPSPERDRAIKLLENQYKVLNPEKPEATSNEMKNAAAIADSIAQRGTEAWNTRYNIELNRLTTKEPKERNIAFGTEAERKSKAKYGKPYADLTPAEAGIIDNLVEQSERAKASASKPEFNMGSTQAIEPKDWLKFSEFINKDPLMTRTSSILSDAPTAIQTIKNSTQNNFSSASLPAAIAKLTGEGKNMSNQDIERYTRTGGLDQRIAGDVVGFFTGKKTDVTKAQAEQFAVALYRGALLERKQFIQDQAESTGYSESPNYKKTIEQLDKKLGQFKLVTPKGSQNSSAPAPKPEDEELINKYLKKP